MGKAQAGPGDSETQRRARSTYELLDSAASLEPGTARRLCEAVREMRRADADMEEARRQLLSSCGADMKDYAAVYRAWIAMMETDSCGIGAARELVLDWGCVCAAEGTADEYAAFWIEYLAFELRHGGGGGASVRVVMVDAARACPRDAAVRAMCAVAERRLAEGPAPRRRWWTRLARRTWMAPSAAVMAVAACRCSPAAAWVCSDIADELQK